MPCIVLYTYAWETVTLDFRDQEGIWEVIPMLFWALQKVILKEDLQDMFI